MKRRARPRRGRGPRASRPARRRRAAPPRPRAARTCRSPRPARPARPRTGAMISSMSSRSSSPTLTRARTGLLVSRNYGLQRAPLVGREVAAVDRRALGEHALAGVERGDLVGERLVVLGRLAPLLDLVLDGLEVGQGQLDLEDPQVLERVAGPGTSSSAKARSTNTTASTSRMWAGTGCPGPRPCWPPRPGRRCRRTARWPARPSCSCDIAASGSSRWSGTLATPTLGSVVAKA